MATSPIGKFIEEANKKRNSSKPKVAQAKKARPAKDLKPGDARSAAAKGPPKKGLPAVTQQNRPRGNPNRASTPKVINQGHTPGSASRALVPYKPKPSALKAGLKTAGKIAAGPAGFLAGMVADAKPAGAGSDKPIGKVRPGAKSVAAAKATERGNPKTTNSYTPKKRQMPAAGSGMSFNGLKASSATQVPKPKSKPSSTPPKPTARPSEFNKGPASGKMSYTPPKPSFKGNWVGAAPTEMQARGGARKTGSGGILGAIKRKLGK